MNKPNKTRLLWIIGLCLMISFAFGCNGGDGDGNGDDDSDRFTMEFALLQYRNFENPAANRYSGLVGLADNGVVVQEADVTDSDVTNSSGTSMVPVDDGFYSVNAYEYDCLGDSCTVSGPLAQTGLWATFDLLADDTYAVEVEMANEQILSADVDFAGMVAIPFIASSSMQSELVAGDLELRWTNPAGEDNWDQVDQLRIIIYDGTGETVINVKLDSDAESVTIPASLIADAQSLGDGNLARWQIQTRAFDDNDMNYARGYSNRVDLSGALPFTVKYAMLQYRTFENAASNTTRGVVGLANDGATIQASDVDGSSLTDSSGGSVTVNDDGVYIANSLFYDCMGDPCNQTGPTADSGLWLAMDSLEADTYSIEIEMTNEQTLNVDIDYPAETAIPMVASGDMNVVWDGDDLDLSWTNPTDGDNWDQVDQLRIEIFDGSNATVINVKLNASATEVTIPASLIADAKALGDGSLAQWRIQTRAIDADNMNYARGYSDKIALASELPFTVEYAMIQFRTFENTSNNTTRGVIGLASDGNIIQGSDVVSTAVTNSSGGSITVDSEGIYFLNTLWYNCMGGPCTQSGPSEDSGTWLALPSLAEDIYTVDIDMTNGQTLSADIDYPVETEIPVITASSMDADWDVNDLDLSWTNPVGGDNWDQVDQLRIELFDGSNAVVIIVSLVAGATDVTIPEALINDALALGDGTLTQWRVQTRAYDGADMNYSRGYSNKDTIPAK